MYRSSGSTVRKEYKNLLMLPALEQSHFQHNHTESEVGTKEFLSPVTAAGSDRHGTPDLLTGCALLLWPRTPLGEKGQVAGRSGLLKNTPLTI